MGLISRNELLAALDWDYEEIEVPKWGTVRIRAFSAGERLALVTEFGSGNLSNEDAFTFFVRLIALSLVDAEGKQLFNAYDEDDLKALRSRSWNRLQFLADRIMAFNGMSQDAAAELEKN